jgi:hypothetical protein
MRAMLNWAKLPENLRKKLWAQCANIATDLKNIIVYKEGDSSSAEKFYGKNPEWVKI